MNRRFPIPTFDDLTSRDKQRLNDIRDAIAQGERVLIHETDEVSWGVVRMDICASNAGRVRSVMENPDAVIGVFGGPGCDPDEVIDAIIENLDFAGVLIPRYRFKKAVREGRV